MKIGHLYCVTGQREILRRLERTIAAQLCVDAELGQKHPAKRVLITDVEPSTLPDGVRAFFDHILGGVDCFVHDQMINERLFSIAKLRNASFNFARDLKFDHILICDADTVFADVRVLLPGTGYGRPTLYWQKEAHETVTDSLNIVQNPDETTFSSANSWFMLSAEVFETVPFNENFHGYGYEDNEFDVRVRARGFSLEATDLRVIHMFHSLEERRIEPYTWARNQALFDHVRAEVSKDPAFDPTAELIPLPASHPDWQGVILLKKDPDRMVLLPNGDEGSYAWEGDALRIDWDEWPAERFAFVDRSMVLLDEAG